MDKELTKIEQFLHGDIIRVVSHTRNCGIDQTVFTAIIVDSKEYGLIAIPQDFQGLVYNAASKGSGWEIEVAWLLDFDVEIYLLERFDELFGRV